MNTSPLFLFFLPYLVSPIFGCVFGCGLGGVVRGVFGGVALPVLVAARHYLQCGTLLHSIGLLRDVNDGIPDLVCVCGGG
jgi:hypothetical protein